MCGIYGVLSYKDKLKDMNELVDLLGMESAERGTDATGVAYSVMGNMKINKSALVHISLIRIYRNLLMR